jgi:hypothetical protein
MVLCVAVPMAKNHVRVNEYKVYTLVKIYDCCLQQPVNLRLNPLYTTLVR